MFDYIPFNLTFNFYTLDVIRKGKSQIPSIVRPRFYKDYTILKLCKTLQITIYFNLSLPHCAFGFTSGDLFIPWLKFARKQYAAKKRGGFY